MGSQQIPRRLVSLTSFDIGLFVRAVLKQPRSDLNYRFHNLYFKRPLFSKGNSPRDREVEGHTEGQGDRHGGDFVEPTVLEGPAGPDLDRRAG